MEEENTGIAIGAATAGVAWAIRKGGDIYDRDVIAGTKGRELSRQVLLAAYKNLAELGAITYTLGSKGGKAEPRHITINEESWVWDALGIRILGVGSAAR